MGRFRKVGGETVAAGTYWNFETGEKVKVEQNGALPGKSSQSFYKAPPFLLLAIVAVGAHLFIYALPKYIAQFYSAHSEKLVTAYVIADFVFLITALAGLFVAGGRDILSGTFRLPSFEWRSYTPVPVKAEDEDPYRDR